MSDGVTTTQSKYQKKRKSEAQPVIEANEVRIKGNQGHVKRYVDYACRLLLGADNYPSDKPKAPVNAEATAESDSKEEVIPDKKFDSIVLKATGRAINKAVTTAEVVKRRIGGLHQVTTLETLEITDVWEPTEAGLKEVETKRRVASITIMLSRDESKVDKNAPGYQIPIAADAIKPFFANQTQRNPRPYRRYGRGRRGGNRNRNFRGPRGGGGYNRNFRGGFNRNYGGGGGYNRNFRGGGGYGGGRRGSPNRSPGGFNRRGGGGGYRGRGGYRGGGYGGGRPRGRGGYNRNNNY